MLSRNTSSQQIAQDVPLFTLPDRLLLRIFEHCNWRGLEDSNSSSLFVVFNDRCCLALTCKKLAAVAMLKLTSVIFDHQFLRRLEKTHWIDVGLRACARCLKVLLLNPSWRLEYEETVTEWTVEISDRDEDMENIRLRPRRDWAPWTERKGQLGVELEHQRICPSCRAQWRFEKMTTRHFVAEQGHPFEALT